MLNLVYIAIAIVAVVYFVVPVFRRQVNTLVSTVWNAIFNSAVGPIEKQKAAYRQAVALLGRERAALVTLMTTARTANTELATRKKTLADAIAKYADATRLGMDEQAKDQYALDVAAARTAVTSQEDKARKAQTAVDTANGTLATVKKSVEQFAATIQDNEGKLELAASNNIATEALQISTSINDALSEAGQATKEVDGTLAASEANLELALGDPNDRKLEQLRSADAARQERARLDAELAAAKPATGSGS